MSLTRRLLTTIAMSMLIASMPVAAQEEAIMDADSEDVADTEAGEANYSPGMYLPFDGSSVEAFEKSMEAIKAETTEPEYTTVQNALDYLLIYDLAARRDREVLYERLDGKTPADVLKMVKWEIRGHEPGSR